CAAEGPLPMSSTRFAIQRFSKAGLDDDWTIRCPPTMRWCGPIRWWADGPAEMNRRTGFGGPTGHYMPGSPRSPPLAGREQLGQQPRPPSRRPLDKRARIPLDRVHPGDVDVGPGDPALDEVRQERRALDRMGLAVGVGVENVGDRRLHHVAVFLVHRQPPP